MEPTPSDKTSMTSLTSKGWRSRDVEALEAEPIIKGISSSHRCICVAMVVIRIFLLSYMAAAGVAFLMTTYSYTDLLMNAVALAFVFELPEFLFQVLVGRSQKEELDEVQPLAYKTSLPDDE